ncbi:MAG: B12-binding domain-containing protein [Spirochaetaceae bacterium]|jgi:methanogenic corrinoid protein MtbC1|nr:B12-binding domain-containing protein [Spirochaetaceae bacterium]
MNLKDISYSLQSGKAKETSVLITQAIKEHYSVESILKQGLIDGMTAVEERFKKNEIFAPEVLVAARAMNIGIKTLRPCLAASGEKPKGTVVVGTVKGDMRDTEKNLMSIMMEGIGLRVVDLGVSVSHERFIEAAERERARIIACLAQRTTTMYQMKILVQALAGTGNRNRLKILITGGPVTENFCQAIGADLYAHDVVSAAETALAYCEKNS